MYYRKNEQGDIIETVAYVPEEDRQNWEYTDEEIIYFYPLCKQMLKSESLTEENKAAEHAYQAAQEVENLRRRRERECFPVINRGAPWYERLTDGQRDELDGWYSAWLDVTDTLTVPEKPAWLEGK